MKNILNLIPLLFIVCQVKAQIKEPVSWGYISKRTSTSEVTLLIKATINDGWHIYSINQKDGGPQRTVFEFAKSKDYELVGKMSQPKPLVKYEKVFGMNVYYFSSTVLFSQKIKLNTKETKVRVKVSFMACSDSECLPPAEMTFSIPVK